MTDQQGTFEFCPPNKARIKLHGKVGVEQIKRILEQVFDHADGQPFFLLEVDISEMNGATPQARELSAKFVRKMPPLAFGMIGGAFVQRTLSKLVLTATALLGGKHRQTSAFFATSEDATSWFEEQAEAYESTGKFA